MKNNLKERSLAYHEENHGKIGTELKTRLNNREDLELAYTPGVAQVCLEIKGDQEKLYAYTSKANTVAVITDGSAVLGLGNLGPGPALPVMEGKAALFKAFGGLDAWPILIDSQDVDRFVETAELISKGFGGINLEDIAAPRCFEIERHLSERLDIPVFHDDQHGTAMVVLAGLINALRITKKSNPKILISGAGAAGLATARLLIEAGFTDLVLADSKGVISLDRKDLSREKKQLAGLTNSRGEKGKLKEIIGGKDVFIGLSAPNILDEEDIRKMGEDPIVFACSNPVPEIDPDEARRAGAALVATGRSDDPNQINNLLVFPGFFKGLLENKIKKVDRSMFLRAAQALADFLPIEELGPQKFIASAFDQGLAQAIAASVSKVDD